MQHGKGAKSTRQKDPFIEAEVEMFNNHKRRNDKDAQLLGKYHQSTNKYANLQVDDERAHYMTKQV